MEKTSCETICGAPTTLAFKGQIQAQLLASTSLTNSRKQMLRLRNGHHTVLTTELYSLAVKWAVFKRRSVQHPCPNHPDKSVADFDGVSAQSHQFQMNSNYQFVWESASLAIQNPLGRLLEIKETLCTACSLFKPDWAFDPASDKSDDK